MGDTPFGFGLPGEPEREPGHSDSGPGDPMGMFGNPQQFADALRQFADMMSWQGGPVNWDLAKNVARHAVAAEGDPSVLDVDRQKIVDALRLADLWLDESTSFSTGVRLAQAWSRSEWVEATLPVWSKLCDPIADRAVDAMGGMLAGDPSELGSGLPPELGEAFKAISGGLSVDPDQVRLYLALREAAHHRLFAHVPWLRAHLLSAVEDYARGITMDAAQLRDAMPQIDPSNPDAIQEALSGAALFQPEDTPQQKAALNRLETALALVEGWVDTVVDAAARDRLPQAGALAEAVRRRRATGGPAEHTFATLVGLELRPRRSREAAAIWRGLTDARGAEGRDAVWSHPDLLPTAEDFDDPDGFIAGKHELDMSELEGPGPESTPDEDGGSE